MAGLQRWRFPIRRFVAFLAICVIASYHAAPAEAGNNGQPPVQSEKDDKGNERVIIGKGWDDGHGNSNEGKEFVELLFDGVTYVLYLSKRTETLLKAKDQLETVKDVLTSEARLWWINERFHWQWGWTEDAKLLLVGDEDDVYYSFFLPPQTKECLAPKGVASVAHYDLFALLVAFVEAAKSRAVMPANFEIQEWDGLEESDILADRSPPQTKVTKGDTTIWLVGRAWQDFTKKRVVDQTRATEIADERPPTETADTYKEETDAYGFRDSQVTVHLPVSENVDLHIVLPGDIRDTLKNASLLDQVLQGLKSPLPSPETMSPDFSLLARFPEGARTALITSDQWSDMRQLLSRANQVIQDELGSSSDAPEDDFDESSWDDAGEDDSSERRR